MGDALVMQGRPGSLPDIRALPLAEPIPASSLAEGPADLAGRSQARQNLAQGWAEG